MLRASQPADEPMPKPPGKASTATTAAATRRSGKSEQDTDKPDGTDLVAGLALMLLNSRNSPLVARSTDTGAGAVKESEIAPQDEALAKASPIARRPAALAKDTNKPAGTDLNASLELTAPGSSVIAAFPDSRVPPPAAEGPLAKALGNAALTTQGTPTPDVQTLQQVAADLLAKTPGSAPLITQSTATLNSPTLQPVAADTFVQNLGSVSSPAQNAANIDSMGAGLVASTDTGSKPTVDPALLATLASPVERERSRAAITAEKQASIPAAISGTAQLADPRATTDATTLTPPAQNNPGLPAAGTAGTAGTAGITSENAGQEKTAMTQSMVSGLTAQAGRQAPPQFEALSSSQSTARLAGPDVNAATDSGAATSMMGSAGAVLARFDVTGGTSTMVVNTTGIVPVLPQNVGSTDWGKALGQHVLHMSRTGQETAELQLNPPGLGPLKISLSMNEHQIQAAFVSTHASVRAAVEAALPQLRAAMADSGISLGETSVGSQSQQAADTRQGQEGRPGQRSHPDSPAGELAKATQRAATEPSRRVNGASVDIYA